jgi:predicted MFS family arabinose efflux permease
MRGYWRLLRENPEFAKLWVSQVISLMGDWFNTVVLSALVARYSDGSGFAVSLFLMARFLPPLVVSPLGGVLVDRFNRQRLMIWSNLLRALIVPLFLLADSPDKLWIIYLVTIVQFTISTVYEPALSAITPSLVKPEELIQANTVNNITWSTMLALGAVLGGVFAFFFGTAAALLADAATFLIAAWLTSIIRYDPERGRKLAKAISIDHDEKEEDTSFAEGLRFVRRTPQIAAALFVKFGGSLGNVDTLLTIFATQIFIIGANGELTLGILYSVYGVGAFLGPIFIERFNNNTVARMRRFILLGFTAMVLSWIFFGTSSSLLILCVGCFVRAVGGSINWTYSTILIQKTAPDAKLGRMFSLDMAGFQLATVLSTLVHGSLIEALGAEHVRLVAWGTCLVALLPLTVWLWIIPYLQRRDAQKILTPQPALD